MTLSRREFLAAAAGAVGIAVQDTVPPPAGRVFDPARAGRALPPVTAADNDAGIQAIEKRLKCSCPCGLDVYTCRTTDFSCTYSPQLHREVLALAGEGKTAQQILDAFVAKYGVAALMAPPKQGFNLAAYFLPSAAILAAAVVLIVVLRRWTRASQAEAALAGPPARDGAPPAASTAELERLQRELERLDV